MELLKQFVEIFSQLAEKMTGFALKLAYPIYLFVSGVASFVFKSLVALLRAIVNLF